MGRAKFLNFIFHALYASFYILLPANLAFDSSSVLGFTSKIFLLDAIIPLEEMLKLDPSNFSDTRAIGFSLINSTINSFAK